MTIEECYSKLGCSRDYWKMVLNRLHLNTAKADEIATYVVKHMKPDGLWDDDEILIAAKNIG